MLVSPPSLLPDLTATIRSLTSTFEIISHERIAKLRELSGYLREQRERPLRLNFICTHNSRRSHLAMVWAGVAAVRYGYPDVQVFSGGTESTAFFPEAVAALERAGFRIDRSGGANPRYRVTYSTGAPPLVCYSKRFDDPVNPARDFAAVIMCSDAEAGCPLIKGADQRIFLPYDDPKVADGTGEMQQRYDERTAEIGREILYAFAAGASPYLSWAEPLIP